MKKIALLTLPFDSNYGWILQLWAQYHLLKSKGYDVTILDRRWNDLAPSVYKTFQRFVFYRLFAHVFTDFMYSELRVSPSFRSTKDLRNYVESHDFDAIIVGSDQVWRIENTRGADLNFYLDFVDSNNITKIAYAASFGKDTWNGKEDEKSLISEYLKQFKLVSVREDSGVTLCEQLFGIHAFHVLDPTLLLKESDYDKLIKEKQKGRKSIATYILDSNEWKEELIKATQVKYGIKKVNTLYPKKRSRFHFYCSVRHWLQSIKNAEYVIIDSFHGMAFSIIFHKQFVVVVNENRGATRFISLLEVLGLTDRLVNVGDSIDTVISRLGTPVDYDEVDKRLSKLRTFSLNTLFSAIEE